MHTLNIISNKNIKFNYFIILKIIKISCLPYNNLNQVMHESL